MKLAAAISGFLARHAEDSAAPVTSRAVGRLMQPLGQPRELDPWLIWSAAALLLLGLVMVFSASIATAEGSRMFGHQPAYFLVRHAVFLAIGVIAGVVAFQIPMRAWQEMAPWLFIAGVVLLLIVLIPHVGRDVNGARRWLPLGVVNLQPSELMKLFAALYAADYTTRKLPLMGSFKQGFNADGRGDPVRRFSCCSRSRTSAPSWYHRDRLRRAFPRRHQCAPVRAAGHRRRGGLRAADHLLRISPPAHPRFHGPVAGRLRQGLPAVPRAHRFWARRVVRGGAGREHRKAVLPARSPHRLPAGGDRRRAGFCRRGGGGRDVRDPHPARLRHRQAGRHAGAHLRRAGCPGHRHLAGRAVLHQHGREHGTAAHQGPDPATDEFRWFRHPRQLRGAGDPAADRLGESSGHARRQR